MPMSPRGSSLRLAIPLALVVLALAAGAAQATDVAASPPPPEEVLQQDGSGGDGTVHYRVEAHDGGPGSSEYWFTWNKTGEVRNPPALLPAGTHVVIEFVNEGAQQHNLVIGGGIDAETEVIEEGESRTLEFDVPEDAPEDLEYWCRPHESLGMKGNATTSPERFEELTTETLEVHADDGGGDFWFTRPETGEAQNPPILLKPGFTYEVTLENVGSVEHNLVFGGPVNESTPLIQPDDTASMNFTVPSDAAGTFDYWCDPHEDLGMRGTVYTNATAYQDALEPLLGDGEHVDIEALGVDYLAYWVGVIAFATIFVVYGLYFYVFKYGGSFTTADHKDRTSHGSDEPGDEWNRTVGWILFLATVAAVGALTAAQLGYV